MCLCFLKIRKLGFIILDAGMKLSDFSYLFISLITNRDKIIYMNVTAGGSVLEILQDALLSFVLHATMLKMPNIIFLVLQG